MSYLIKGATIVNENKTFKGDVFIENEEIKEIASALNVADNVKIINAEGKYLIPGFIDDQVHFREPGLTHKANIETESRAAAAGGITTFIEQPNTVPQATNQKLLEDKFQIASKSSYVNYSFMFGGTNDNLEEQKMSAKDELKDYFKDITDNNVSFSDEQNPDIVRMNNSSDFVSNNSVGGLQYESLDSVYNI